MKTIIPRPLFDIFQKKKKIEKIETTPKEKIIIDYREKNSLVASYLVKQGFPIEFRELKVGDYVVQNIVIERKTISDFISSMLNHRLINQLEELKQYENKLLIIEGISENELYSEEKGGINPNAIRGFLLSVILKHKIPTIFTKNSEDSAKFINVLSRKKEKEINLNAKKKTLNKKEQLQFIIEGFPGIGPKTAKKLLGKFKTIENIINAPEEELKETIRKKAGIIIDLRKATY